MRTFTIGLLGGLLVFAFYFYRGDIGCVPAGPLGQFCPPAESSLIDRIRELQAEQRAITGFGESREVVEAQSNMGEQARAQRFYAGRLIARPRQNIALPEGANVGDVRSFSVNTNVESAVEGALAVGDIERVGRRTMMISLDYDITDEDFAEEGVRAEMVRPERAERVRNMTRGFSNFSTGAAAGSRRGLAASSRAVMAAVSRRRPRLLQASEARCPANPTPAQLERNPALAVACAARTLEDSGEFDYVELDYLISHEMMMSRRPQQTVSAAPNDPLLGLQWHYLNQGEGNSDENAPGGAGFLDFWERQGQSGSREVVVAVIDTGLALNHPAIVGSANVVDGVDMVSVAYHENDDVIGRDRDPNDPGDACAELDGPYAEDSYHGTHVAGTVGAVSTNDGDGVAGGAWNVTVVPIRALGRCGGLQSDIIDAIRWAVGLEPAQVTLLGGETEEYWNANPAQIINLSLGFRTPGGCPRSMQDAINDAVGAGAIVVAAAGNAGLDVEEYSPAGCDNVVTVSAGDFAGELAWYSNYGAGVDIMAPGGDLLADLNNDNRPDGVLSIRPGRDCVDPETGETFTTCDYAYENGTSMAAPHVSAAFALLRAQYRDATNEELISLVVDTARAPRTETQCRAACSETPGGTPITGEPGQCFRPCGAGLMDLGRAVRE